MKGARANWLKFAPYGIFLILLLIVVAKSFLLQSFWLDECVTFWVTKDSLSDSIFRSVEFQGQSPLYYICIWGLRQVLGSSELAFRSLSLLALAGSCFFLYKFAVTYFEHELALLAVALFLSIDSVLLSLSARPYGLALLFALGSMVFLWKYLKEPRTIQLILYVLSTIAAFYCHYLFVLVLLPQFLTVLLSRKKIVPYLFAVGAILVMSLPGLSQLLSLWSRRTSLFFTSEPTFFRLFNDYLPTAHVVYIFCGMLLVFIFFGGRGKTLFKNKGIFNRTENIFLLSWFLIPPLPFFIYAKGFGAGLFVERYFLWQAPALALIGTSVVALLDDAKVRRVAVCLTLVFICIREFDRSWRLENWREVITTVNVALEKEKMPVFLYSGLIENLNEAWLHDTFKADYLKAPVAAYPIEGGVVVSAPQAEKFIYLYLNNKYRMKIPDEMYQATPIVDNGLVQAWVYRIRSTYAHNVRPEFLIETPQ